MLFLWNTHSARKLDSLFKAPTGRARIKLKSSLLGQKGKI